MNSTLAIDLLVASRSNDIAAASEPLTMLVPSSSHVYSVDEPSVLTTNAS